MPQVCGCTPLKNFRMLGQNEARCLNCGGLIAFAVDGDAARDIPVGTIQPAWATLKAWISEQAAAAINARLAGAIDDDLAPKPSTVVADFLRSLPGVKP